MYCGIKKIADGYIWNVLKKFKVQINLFHFT